MAVWQMPPGLSGTKIPGMPNRCAATVLIVLIAALSAAVALPMFGASPAQAEGGTAPKCGGGKISLNNEERAVFSLHNRIRKERNIGSLCVHPALQKAARAHSEDMIRRDYFSHDDEGGRTFDARLKSFGYDPKGYRYYLVGENIAFGSGSYGEPENIMDSWMKSDGHRRNILKKEFREIGVGAYTGTYKYTEGVTMYTADFGVRRR